MIDAAERDGLLKPGGTIVEPTSGNTGVGLAIVAAQRGYKCVFVMTDKVAPEKIALLRAYGAEVVVCPVAVAARGPAVVLLDGRAARPRDPRALPPEPVRQPHQPAGARRIDRARDLAPDRRPDHPLRRRRSARAARSPASAATSSRRTPACRSSAPTPKARCTRAGRGGRTWSRASARTSGPRPTTRRSSTGSSRSATRQSFLMARRVAREEGLLIGGSGGTAVAAAVRVAHEAGPDDIVVVLIPDSGRGYLSRVFNDEWMANFGFLRECDLCVAAVLDARGASRCRRSSTSTRATPCARRSTSCARTASASCRCARTSRRSRPPRCRVRVDELELMDAAFRDPSVIDIAGRRR